MNTLLLGLAILIALLVLISLHLGRITEDIRCLRRIEVDRENSEKDKAMKELNEQMRTEYPEPTPDIASLLQGWPDTRRY